MQHTLQTPRVLFDVHQPHASLEIRHQDALEQFQIAGIAGNTSIAFDLMPSTKIGQRQALDSLHELSTVAVTATDLSRDSNSDSKTKLKNITSMP